VKKHETSKSGLTQQLVQEKKKGEMKKTTSKEESALGVMN